MRTFASELIFAVADVLSDIPEGHVCSYGDVAAVIGTGPRQVGAVMASGVVDGPWWRIIRSDGTLPDDLWRQALDHYHDEGTPHTSTRVIMREARWVIGS